MTAETDLLPLPEWCQGCGESLPRDMQDYARACVIHATAAKDAEIEALRAEVDEWKRVAAAQAELQGEAEERAERLAEALGRILENEASDYKAAEEFGGYVLDDELREEARAALSGVSAPVGVEGLLQRIDAAIERVTTGRAAMRIPADPTDLDLVLADARNWIKQAALAQQPAAAGEESSKGADVARPKRRPYNASASLSEYGVFPECDAQQPAEGEDIMVNTPYDVFILPLRPSGLSSGPRFVVHVPAPEQQTAEQRAVEECPQGHALRDYFAAKAMAAFIAEPVHEGESLTAWRWASQSHMHTQMSGPDIVAHAAYMMADAMLKAREAGNG